MILFETHVSLGTESSRRICALDQCCMINDCFWTQIMLFSIATWKKIKVLPYASIQKDWVLRHLAM